MSLAFYSEVGQNGISVVWSSSFNHEWVQLRSWHDAVHCTDGHHTRRYADVESSDCPPSLGVFNQVKCCWIHDLHACEICLSRIRLWRDRLLLLVVVAVEMIVVVVALVVWVAFVEVVKLAWMRRFGSGSTPARLTSCCSAVPLQQRTCDVTCSLCLS